MDRNAELTQPAHVMSYDSISLALIQRGHPTLHIGLAGAEYLEDKLEKCVGNGNQGRPFL